MTLRLSREIVPTSGELVAHCFGRGILRCLGPLPGLGRKIAIFVRSWHEASINWGAKVGSLMY